MASPKPMLQQIAALFRGNLVHALSQVVVIALVSKIGGSAAAGKYVFALAATAPIFMFFDFNLRVVRSTDHRYGEVLTTYIALRLYTLALAVIVVLITCLVFYPTRLWILVPILAFRVGESISNLAYGGLQRMQSSHLIGRSLARQGFISISVTALVVPLASGNEIAAASAMAMVSVCWAIFYDVPLSWKINGPEQPLTAANFFTGITDIRACTRILKRAFPLGFDAGISSIGMNAPKYFIEYFIGTEALGVFGLLSQLAYAMQKFIGAMGHAGVGALSKHYGNQNRTQFWRLFNRMLASSIGVGVVAVIGGTLVLPIAMRTFWGPAYADTWLIFGLLLASALTGAQRIAGRATQACSQYLAYTSFDILICLTSVVASYYLVQHHGAVGGAAALVIAFAVGLLVTLLHAYRFLWANSESALVADAT